MPLQKKVENMKEMKEALQAYLLKEVEAEEYEEEEEKGNDKKIKTYIIESNINKPKAISKIPSNANIIKTEDENLINIGIRLRNTIEYIYVDASDPRFWLFHTASESGFIDDFMNDIVARNNSYLDYSWFSSNFLEGKCNIGYGSGFGLKFKNFFLSKDDELKEKYLSSFSMLFWGGRPDEVIAGLKKNPDIASGLTLSRINRVFETDDGIVNEQINRKGKFTLFKGDSIDSHFLAVDTIKKRYANLIRNFEKYYRIKYCTTDFGYRIEGTYCLIELNREIENRRRFFNILFSCNKPFLLFGIPQFVEQDLTRVCAVDLHTNDKFNIEIGQDFIRIFLYEKSCGNVIARLMTNLQEFYDSQIELVGINNEQIL